ncbi:hypothetical protein STEG23_033720 [Scotinomys teguina]
MVSPRHGPTDTSLCAAKAPQESCVLPRLKDGASIRLLPAAFPTLEELRVMSSLLAEADVTSGGPYGESQHHESPEPPAVRGSIPKLKIKKSTLERFLEECDTVAPWFAVSGSLTVSSWEKLGRNLDFAAEQGTLKSRVCPVWKLVRSCLDQRCHEAVENGQAALEILQEERSEKAASERENKDRKRKQHLYPDLTEFRDSDEGESGSESSDEMDSIISDFVASMVEAVGRIFGAPDVAMPLIKQLVYEQCTRECCEGPRMCWSIKTLQYC